ncbi:MAG: hypothetical protein F4X20_09175 [Dehalococcoidia bacterium]|nr:hypothetical protein [Dehalococcoidia bacterium]
MVIDPPFGKNQTFEGQLKPPLEEWELEHEYDLLAKWGIQNEDDAYDAGLEFPDQTGTTAKFRDIWSFRAQVTEDEWNWIGSACEPALHLIEATRRTHSDSIAAYIAFMTLRMIEIKRILKPTGSVYVHCDHEANAYLRQMMDAVFGQRNFRNEITWERTRGRSDGNHWGNVTDTILFYVRTPTYIWQNTYENRRSEVKDSTLGDLTAPETRNGKSGQTWQGYNPTVFGRHWAVPRNNRLAEWIGANHIPDYLAMKDPHDRLDALNEAGLIVWSDDGRPSIFRPAETSAGAKINNLWTDIGRTPQGERTGYKTQKPQALARRIIEASSNPGDVVLDCFAGCAYVPVAAETAESGPRRWIACDMSPRAWTVIRRQFHNQPDLRIVTEGEIGGASEIIDSPAGPEHYREGESINVRLGDERIIKVRGPNELPERSPGDEQPQPVKASELPPPEFRQRVLEKKEVIWEAFVDKWGTRCWYCGTEKARDRRELQLDHIEPNKRDGSNDDCWNRALACAPCNSDKDNKLTVEQTINKARESGRIQTDALRDRQATFFEEMHAWAKQRWTRVKQEMGVK